MHFADRLIQAIKKKNSVVCMGLDPELSKLPLFLVNKNVQEHGKTRKAAAHASLEFNKGLIDAVFDLLPAVKPQLAFYEALGFEGIWAFEETCKYAKAKGLMVIADGKRNDIGSTSEAYVHAFLGGEELFGQAHETSIDALTVNAYLGFDGIRPFLQPCEEMGKGIFVLVRTSNPSSGDLQERTVADEKMSIAQLMAHFVESWGVDLLGESGYSLLGAVVGATHPSEAALLRKIMPHSFFLVPGYGAQGGTAENTKPCFDKNGLGALIVNARGIIYAYQKNESSASGEAYAEAARDSVIKMNEALAQVR